MRRLLAGLLMCCCASPVVAQADDPARLLAEAATLPEAEALAHYDRALARLGPDRQAQWWLQALARKCWLITHAKPQAALELVALASPHAARFASAADYAQLTVCGGYAEQRLERPARALAAYDAGVAAGRALREPGLLARALVLRGELHYERGAWSDAMADLKAAFEASDAQGDAGGRAYALTAIANLYGSAGEHGRAIDYYRQTLAIARATAMRQNEATALYNLGVSHDKLGDPASALAHYREALAVQRAAGIDEDLPDTLRSIAISQLKLGQAQAALARLDEAQALPAAAGEEMQAALALTRGAALRQLGRAAEALPLLERAQAWFESSRQLPFLEKIEDERAQALAQLGQASAALAARERQLAHKEALHQAWRGEQTARLRVEFDTDRTEQENRRLATENALRAAALRDAERIRSLQNWVIACAVLALLALAALALLQVRHACRLRRIALTDELTGLPNRRATIDYARRQLERRARGAHPVSVVALDIDHFKRINDTFGHDAGDVVLKRVARALQTHFDGGLVGRVGGEEFLAVLPDSDRRRSAAVAEAVRRIIERIDLSDVDPKLQVSSSFGIAEVESGQDWEAAAKRADEALYRAKHAGRNRVVVAGADVLAPA